MILKTDKTRKMESAIDIFKGTCELNAFEPVKIYRSGFIDEEANIPLKGKFYYILEDIDMCHMEAISFTHTTHELQEIINMGVKALYNMGIEDVKVVVDEQNREDTKYLMSDLETLEIPAEYGSVNTMGDKAAFAIFVSGRHVASGGITLGEYTYLSIDYYALEEFYNYKETGDVTDVIVCPKAKIVLSDAFIVATNLRDAGLKVEVDYSLGIDQLNSSTFLIEVDKKAMSKFRVKLIDRNTHEEQDIAINDLVEVLLYR